MKDHSRAGCQRGKRTADGAEPYDGGGSSSLSAKKQHGHWHESGGDGADGVDHDEEVEFEGKLDYADG